MQLPPVTVYLPGKAQVYTLLSVNIEILAKAKLHALLSVNMTVLAIYFVYLVSVNRTE